MRTWMACSQTQGIEVVDPGEASWGTSWGPNWDNGWDVNRELGWETSWGLDWDAS